MARSFSATAKIFGGSGAYSKSLEYYEKALAIYCVVLGETHLDTAPTYSNMTDMRNCRVNFARALEFYAKALDVQIAAFGRP